MDGSLDLSMKRTCQMTLDEIEAALARARKLGHDGSYGSCGSFAIAMNHVLLDNCGEYIAILHTSALKMDRWLGHVLVRYEDRYYDSHGAAPISRVCHDYRDLGVEEDSSWVMSLPVCKRPSFHRSVYGCAHAYGNSIYVITEAELRHAFCVDKTQPVEEIENVLRRALELR
jgi:hypothetical protein